MSDGYCEVDFEDVSDDAEQVEFYDSKTVRARKAHRCSECGGEIAKGEAHERISYRFEGTFQTDRRCIVCREIAGEFGYAMLGGMLWECFAEEWSNGANLQGCLNRLETARAKEHMRQQWMKWDEKRRQRRTKRQP